MSIDPIEPNISHKPRRKNPPAPVPTDDSWRGRTWDEIHFGTYIYDKGEKVTKARTNVLSALSRFDRPVSIKELSASSAVKDQNMSTLYRTLETLATAKLVRKIGVDAAQSMYETAIGRPHHHHIVCTACGQIEAIDICVQDLSQKTLHSKGFSAVTDHSLEFFGVCNQCA